MDNKHSSKTAIYQEAFDFQPDFKLAHLTPIDSDQNGYDVFMGFVELSASLGNFHHNVPKTMKFLAENGTHQRDPCELVLLNNFRKVLGHHNNDPDENTRIFHEARGEFFMTLYHLLMVDTELEDKQGLPFMELCYELIGSDRQKNSEEGLMEHVNCLLAQVKNVMQLLLDSVIRDTDSPIDKYLASMNQMLDSKIESVRNLHADKKSISLQLGGLSIKKGIGVVHNRRLTTAAGLWPEEIILNLINRFSDMLAITQKSYLDSERIRKEKESSSRSSPSISKDEATSAEDIFADFRESNFICDSKESFHGFNTKNVSEDSSSNGFDKDFLVSSVLNICQKASMESEVLETPKPLQMVRSKYFSQELGPFATSSEDDDTPLLDFSQIDSKESLKNIDINSKKEVFSDLEKSSEENQPEHQPLSNKSSITSSRLENELKESSNMIEEAKDNHKNESPKQSGLVKENMMSEESESQLPSFKERPETLGDITASIAYPNTNDKCLSDCPVSLKKSDEEIISSIKVKENVSHDSTIHGNLKKIQNLFSDFSNIIETMNDGSESTDLKMHKVTPTSSSFNGSVESPIIGRKDYLNYETPHLELYEKNSSGSSFSNEIGCEKYLSEKGNDDEEPRNPFLCKISQTLSESKLNVLKEVDKSLTELQKMSFLPGSNIEEKSGSLQVAEMKNDSPIVEIYKSSKPRNSYDDLEKPTNETCNKHSSREILNYIKQTASDIKLNILKTMDKSLLALTSSSEISEKIPELCPKNSPKPPWVKTSIIKVSEEIQLPKTTVDVSEDNCVNSDKDEQMDDCNLINKLTTAPDKKTSSCSEISENEIVSDSLEIKSDSDRKSENFLKWQHQRHIIAAPGVIIKLLKSKSTPERSREDKNELSFFEQLDQFFEIMNMENCSLSSEINLATIQARLGKFLSRIKRQLPNVLNHSDLVAVVAKYHLKNLLTRQERFSYEAVRLQLRDKDLDGKIRFEAALYGMLGYESPHLKATDGRLQMRLPHHQENIGESYLMVAFGHLGYLYRSLQEHVERLGRKGDIANAVRKCLQKELLSFYELYNLRKNQPCSLLQLYRETRVFQWRFQWLLHVLQKFINEKSIIVCLIKELDNRVGAQRLLIQNWLNSASKLLVAKLCRWLISDHLTPLDRHELPIERCKTSTNNYFWQNRYMVTDTFSKVFDSKLLEMILSTGKTQVYSQKYLGLPVEISCNIKDLNYKMRDAFTQFYEDKDQEPLYKLLCKLHLKVSASVLAHFDQKKIEPENLFQNLHHYLMLADHRFCRELIDILEPVLEEPANSYNAELLNQMVEQMPSKPLPDLYVAEAPGSGIMCWSRFLLRWRFPHYWIALLGKEAEEYDMIFMGLWKFHYTNYVFRERVARQQYHFSKRLELKCFNGVAEVELGFAHLIKYIAGVMKVLRSYFLDEVLEQAYVKLLNDCKGAKTLDDFLKANRVYLQDIKDGWFQTQISHMAIHQLERILSLIIDLESQQHKFVRLSQILLDSLKEDREKNKSKSSRSHRNRMQEFYWSCQNTCEALNVLEQRFHLAMIDFLISLHQANRESFRLLAKKLDSVGYYEKRNEKLWLIQRFAYKRKAKMLKSDGSTLQQTL